MTECVCFRDSAVYCPSLGVTKCNVTPTNAEEFHRGRISSEGTLRSMPFGRNKRGVMNVNGIKKPPTQGAFVCHIRFS